MPTPDHNPWDMTNLILDAMEEREREAKREPTEFECWFCTRSLEEHAK